MDGGTNTSWVVRFGAMQWLVSAPVTLAFWRVCVLGSTLDATVRTLCCYCHLLEVRNECLLAIRDMRIVLPVHGARVSLNRLSWLALVKHEVVKLFRRSFITFESIIHGSVLAVSGCRRTQA